MEQLNKIEIIGYVGNVNITKVGNGKVAKFSVATSYAYKGKNDEPVIETTWLAVTAFESNDIPASTLEGLSKGDQVHVCGRLRWLQYTNPEGETRTTYEIIASSLTKTK